LANKRGNIGLGNLTGLRPINPIITTSTNTTNTTTTNNTEVGKILPTPVEEKEESTKTNQQYTDANTKIMKITLDTFERLQNHSRRYYNIENYDTIIKNLIDHYDKSHDQKWF
jgi:hypothetical protein